MFQFSRQTGIAGFLYKQVNFWKKGPFILYLVREHNSQLELQLTCTIFNFGMCVDSWSLEPVRSPKDTWFRIWFEEKEDDV